MFTSRPDKNEQSRVKLLIAKYGISKNSSPALDAVYLAHARALINLEIAVDTLDAAKEDVGHHEQRADSVDNSINWANAPCEQLAVHMIIAASALHHARVAHEEAVEHLKQTQLQVGETKQKLLAQIARDQLAKPLVLMKKSKSEVLNPHRKFSPASKSPEEKHTHLAVQPSVSLVLK